MELNPNDQFFEFVHPRIGFLDAEDRTNHYKKAKSNSGSDCPIIYDKKEKPEDAPQYEEHQLTQTGAFILGFVLQKVEKNLIAQIYSSEYGLNLSDATKKVEDFIKDLINRDILKVSTKRPTAGDDPRILQTTNFTGIYDVDFGVGTNPAHHIRVGYVT
jgi:hypothetical protein